jgi:hypothetical protein
MCEDYCGIPIWGSGFSGGRAEDIHERLGLSWPLINSLAAWAEHWNDKWTRTTPTAWVEEGRRLADWVRAELDDNYTVEYWRELFGPNLYVKVTPDSTSPLWDEAGPIGELGLLRHRLELSEQLVEDLYTWAGATGVNDPNRAGSARTVYAPEPLRARVQAELGVTFHVYVPD